MVNMCGAATYFPSAGPDKCSTYSCSRGEACQTQEILPWIWDSRPVDQNCCELLSNNAMLLRRLVDFLGLGNAVWAWSSAGRLRLTSRGLTSSTLEAPARICLARRCTSHSSHTMTFVRVAPAWPTLCASYDIMIARVCCCLFEVPLRRSNSCHT